MMNKKEFEEILEKYGAKQVENFWINSIIELTPAQIKVINEKLNKTKQERKIKNGENNINKKSKSRYNN